MCSLLKVARSGFYRWLKHPESDRAKQDKVILAEILFFFDQSDRCYGSPRLLADLRSIDIRCGEKRVARIMRENGIVSEFGYKKRPYQNGKPSHVAPNILAQNFSVDQPNKIWVTDITYIRTWEGWLFLAVVTDLFSRKVVGWAMGPNMKVDLVLDAMVMAVWRRKPKRGLMIHSDQGCQFGSFDWINFLRDHGIEQSMSRRGNCFDNAAQESFFGSMKKERIKGKPYRSHKEAKADIFNYIEMFYNPRRRHSTLGNVSPVEYEKQYVGS